MCIYVTKCITCLLVILNIVQQHWKSLFFFVTDFAVGAPYDEDGAGTVYIYHGSQEGLKSTKAAQVCG